MRTIEELIANYPVRYAFEVCQLGSYRLGTPLGWNVMGVRSASRLDADRNYAEVVIPAPAQILPEHSGYLALRARRSEERRVGKACVSTCRSRWSPDH